MIENNLHIEIVRSKNKALSLMSKESCDALASVLATHYTHVGVTYIMTLKDLEALVHKRPDLVFLGMESLIEAGQTVWLADFLDQHDIAYTGSNKKAHKLARDKSLAKQRVLTAKLQTSAFLVTKQHQPLHESDISLDYPLFIKPTSRGGGLGIDSDSIVYNFEHLQKKVEAITTHFHSDVLIEKYLPGREFSVAILKDELTAGYAAMPIELVAPPDNNGKRVLSGSVKSANSEKAQIVNNHILKAKLTSLALAVFFALGARDYGRIDIRLDEHDMPQFLEANLLPSLISGYGSFPKACLLNNNLSYEAMILAITRLGLTRRKLVTENTIDTTFDITPDLKFVFEAI